MRIIRNRYAKLQPLANRISGLQNPAANTSNYHRASRSNELGIDSYARQLQNDFGNLILATSSKAEAMTRKQMDREAGSPKIAAPLLVQPIFAETARRHKKHKHRNKEKLYRTSLLGLEAALLNILHCILCIAWYPLVFLARLLLNFASFSVSVLYKSSRLFALHEGKATALKSSENKPEMLNSISAENSPKGKQLVLNRGSSFLAQEAKTGGTIGQPEKRQKNSESPRKSFNLSLQLVDKMCGNLKLGDANYFHYLSHHQDISSVELSSDCLSDKYSSRFLEKKDCRKKLIRQYQDSFSTAGRKPSVSTLRNSSFTAGSMIINSKQQSNRWNSTRRSEFRSSTMNPDFQISHDALSLEQKLHRMASKSQSHATNECTGLVSQSVDCNSSITEAKSKFDGQGEENSADLLNNFRKNNFDKSKMHTFSRSPRGPTLQKQYLFDDKEKVKEGTETCGCALSDDLKTYPAVPESKNSNLQPIAERDCQVTKRLNSYLGIDRDLTQKNERDNSAIVLIGLNQYNAQKLMSGHKESTFSQYKVDLGKVRNEPTVLEHLKDVSELKYGAAQRDESEKLGKISEAANPGGVQRGLPECKKTCKDFKEDKRTIGSGDCSKLSKNEVSRAAEFTKPIDAKSKWLEMKKKFYGKDYATEKEQPEKLEAQSLARVKSVSKLPAHKIFQYNMLMGRARQVGVEPPSAEGIILEKKDTSPCQEALQIAAPDLNSTRSRPKPFQLAVPTSHCLSQTQSLSQWPLEQGNYYRRETKNRSPEQKPKPKPRTEGGFSRQRIGGNAESPTMSRTAGHFPQRTSVRANSSISSSDVRIASQKYSTEHMNRKGLKSARLMHRAKEQQLVQLSDEEAKDEKTDKTTIKEQEELGANLLELDQQLSSTKDVQNPGLFSQRFNLSQRDNPAVRNRPKPLSLSAQMANPPDTLPTKNINPSNKYVDRIDSLISFCEYPPSAPIESIDRNFEHPNHTAQKFLNTSVEVAPDDSS